LKTYGDIDSKFRFVILASMRAKQLLRGAKPSVKSKSKNLIRVAQEEVKKGLIDYEIVQDKQESFHEPDEEMLIGEEVGKGSGTVEGKTGAGGKKPENDKEQKDELKKKPKKKKKN